MERRYDIYPHYSWTCSSHWCWPSACLYGLVPDALAAKPMRSGGRMEVAEMMWFIAAVVVLLVGSWLLWRWALNFMWKVLYE